MAPQRPRDERDRGPGDDPALSHLFGGAGHRRPPALAQGPGSTVAAILGRTWSTYQTRLRACVAIYWGEALVNLSILMAVLLVLNGLNDAFRQPEFLEFCQFLFFLVQIIVPTWLQIGLNRAVLQLARSGPVAFEDLFRGGRYLLSTLVATSVLLAVGFVPLLAVYVSVGRFLYEFEELSRTMAVGSLLSAAGAPASALAFLNDRFLSQWDGRASSFVLAFGCGIGLVTALALFVLVRLGQFGYVIFDRDAGVLGSLQGSWRLTEGRVAVVFLVYAAALAINLAGLLAFCVGLIFTMPLTNLLLAQTYQVLSESAPGWEPSGPEGLETDDT